MVGEAPCLRANLTIAHVGCSPTGGEEPVKPPLDPEYFPHLLIHERDAMAAIRCGVGWLAGWDGCGWDGLRGGMAVDGVACGVGWLGRCGDASGHATGQCHEQRAAWRAESVERLLLDIVL